MLNFSREKYLTVTGKAVGLREEIEKVADKVNEKGFKNIFLIGSGGALATFYPFEFMINSISNIPAYAEIAAEFVLQNHKQFSEESLVILSSLSGTTQETVAAAKYCKESIPVRSFSGDLIKKSPLGMMQGCQTTPTIMPRRTSDELYTKS
ncbi:SIS domain-containing protein [Aeribacillus pallidus]|uniref:SIS domain-containing protein n=1 Tax=Aeribacillus pallidus TaxID=33936 RepID=A0A223E840_9BACI|nr:SIS domain-containing protein [Aeribacillus pallidus]ASS91406.1 hypothetical protein AP3564_15330 [Aeribacillus pallidus]